MLNIGITGQQGFVGYHVYHFLRLSPTPYTLINFEKQYFNAPALLDQFVNQCDVIIHLAGVNRHSSPTELYQQNVNLTQQLIAALHRTRKKNIQVLFSSSIQEDRNNPYGQAKQACRKALAQWAADTNNVFTGLLIPNVFGAFGKPNYNSVVASFCHQLCHQQTPKIEIDAELKLIYIDELVQQIEHAILNKTNNSECLVPHTQTISVSSLLSVLNHFYSTYFLLGNLPALPNRFEMQLFNTFRSYIPLQTYYPKHLQPHTDVRGNFTELLRAETGGQVSVSTTHPTITRGNHFHTRKIERFIVLQGQAEIALRKIGTDTTYRFLVNGNQPTYVDMPIWHSHSITNVGPTELLTLFWINEPYNPHDADTYFETV